MTDSNKPQQIQRVLDECLRRRAAGEELSDAEVVAEHAELMPELSERLAALRLIEQAGQQAADSSAAAALPPDHIEGHCPHCGAHWRLRTEHAGRRVRCRKCGQVFAAGDASSSAASLGSGAGAGSVAESVPGYEIEGDLGHGGMGRVYRARELATKRTVALKVMLAGRYADERQRRRFEREVELAAALQHPHIARIYASGLHEGHHWFAMEYVEGVPLDTYVEREHLALGELLALFARICHAVNHAHQRGIMHRDLKPGNILVDERNQPHVLDFGLAKATDRLAATDESISMPGEVAGTPAYMSPEQTRGDPAQIDVRSDVYSLGVILYRLLTGQSPYGEQKGIGALLKAINELEPEPPRRVRKDVPDEVDAIVRKALRKDSAERYQTAGELARDVEAYLAGDVVTAKRGSGWYTLRKTALRYKRLAGAIAVVVVLSLGLGLTFGTLWTTTRVELQEVTKERTVYRDRLVQLGLDPQAPIAQAIEADLADARDTVNRLRDEVRAQRARADTAEKERLAQRARGDAAEKEVTAQRRRAETAEREQGETLAALKALQAQQSDQEAGQFSHVVTFKTAEKAPARFEAWTFMWVIPERDVDAALDYVVLEPDGDEYLRYDLTQAAPGQQTRSDFMPGFAGGDPAVFFGKHIEFRVRTTKGTLRFRNPGAFEFQFYKKKDDGQVDLRTPFARTKAVIHK